MECYSRRENLKFIGVFEWIIFFDEKEEICEDIKVVINKFLKEELDIKDFY